MFLTKESHWLGTGFLFSVWGKSYPGYLEFWRANFPENRQATGVPIFENLGPLYTRSQGQCSTQIEHSHWCKSWNQHQGLHTRSQSWNRKNIFNLPQATNNKCWTLWPCIGLKAEKWNLGTQFSTLGAKQQAKNAQSRPQVFFGPDS